MLRVCLCAYALCSRVCVSVRIQNNSEKLWTDSDENFLDESVTRQGRRGVIFGSVPNGIPDSGYGLIRAKSK